LRAGDDLDRHPLVADLQAAGGWTAATLSSPAPVTPPSAADQTAPGRLADRPTNHRVVHS
ncbi:MAG TPA: hypothetical protein VEO94_09390, partial [Candidatus Dormibacteraeota bacterium]|nr:hypothetical protein [Candidatus Dormibacteraeota bacterium]